ncbi:succinyl-CoA synthetase subunit alpha [Patescibacteria group bacterium]|nr:succinyl-CoA synthetase subunit alpha [Patescibacteria group bacterium]
MAKKSKKIQRKNIPLIHFSKFRGKEVALVDGKIVAEGESSKEVFEKAKKLFPMKSSKEIVLLFVPKEEIFAYFIYF